MISRCPRPSLSTAHCPRQVIVEHSQTHIPLEIEVRMIDLLRAPDFGRFMGVVEVDGECKGEFTALVDSYRQRQRLERVSAIALASGRGGL